MPLPPNVIQADFDAALAAFRAVVGNDWVFTSDEDMIAYKDAYSPFLGEPEERWASAAVAPHEAEHVQEIVRIANRYNIPLYAFSTGKNLGYGGAAPGYSGCVVVDLKRMDKIIEVNDKNFYCLVEPGVSYFDLYRYIQEKGLKVWIDCPDPGWGSVVGNALDRGAGYTMPGYRNHFEAHCGMEVVLANGELMRTGMGALPNSQTWQQYKSGFGPYIDGIFSQSNFGIVTKMGFWLMPEPEAYLKNTILLPRYNDWNEFIPLMNYLEALGIYNGCPEFGSPLLSIPPASKWLKAFSGDLPPPNPDQMRLAQASKYGFSEELQAYGINNNIPYWSVSLPLYGGAKAIQGQWEYIKEKCAIIPDVKFEETEVITMPLKPENMDDVAITDFGIPSLKNFSFGARSRLNPNPTHGHIWFSPVLPRTGEAIYESNKLFIDTAKEFDVPLMFPFLMPAATWEHSLMAIFGFGISEDPEANKKTRMVFSELIKRCADKGWGEYRTGVIFQDEVMEGYSFNNNILRKFLESIKDAIDPNGILSPGRYGIWPKKLRDRKK